MPARKLIGPAVLSALLTCAAAPAHAATIQWDLSGVTVSGISPAITVTGFFDYDAVSCCSAANFPDYSLSVSGPSVEQGGIGSFTLTPSNSYIQGGTNVVSIENDGASAANLEIVSLGSDGSFDGTSGSLLPLSPYLSSVVGNDIISFEGFVLQGELKEIAVTPLPPALPMFGAAMLALVGFAAWLRRAGRA